jgi:Phage integrase, N-terminal SAM-like domain
MTPSPRRMTPLRQRMIEDMKLRNLSPHTVQVYVDRVAAFAKHFGMSPEFLGPKELRAYLVFLVEENRVSWSYYGQAICTLRFLYRVTLGKERVVKGVVSPKKEMKLPVILSRAEVTQFLEAITSLNSTHRAKTFNTILMCIASCREVGSLPMARAGSPAGQDSSCRCALKWVPGGYWDGQGCRLGSSTVRPSAWAAALRSRSAETRVTGREPAA